MTQLTCEIQTRQQTSLTPRLQQSVKLLQMSTLDFNREVAEAIAANPFLEDGTEIADSSDVSPAAVMAEAAAGKPDVDTPDLPAPDQAATAASHDGPGIEHLEYNAGEAERNHAGSYPSVHSNDHADNDVGAWARSPVSLQDSLRADLYGCELTARERCLIEFIIDALDSDGYLRTPFADLADAHRFSPAITDGEWTTALKLVQQLGAPGLGARDLSECLRLQLNALPGQTPYRELALRIAAGGLDKLARCDYAGLMRLLACNEEEIKRACVLIRSLNPRPGASFIPTDASSYVIPDASVRKAGKLWVAVPNQEATPQVHMNDVYAKLFRQSHGGDRSLMSQALQEARWLLRSLEQRSVTIQRVAQAIVARQQTFFDYGAIALRPMMLKEIADELGLHESTISRATTHKYLATPRGILEFKYFFSRELATNSGGKCSAMAVRALIREMIEEENPKEPLSDVVLASKLAREGVIVARRTVSKYRSQIKYPAAELRRAL